jgi:hypothetical protein
VIGALTVLRIPFEDRDQIASIGGVIWFVMVSSLWGGLCGIIYALSAPWRRAGGLKRATVYALMGAMLGVILLAALAADGLMTGEPPSAWISTLLISSGILAVCALIARKWFDFIGMLPDR